MAQHDVKVNLQLMYDPRSARAFQQIATEAAKANAAAQKQVAGAFATRAGRLNEISGIASNLGAYGFAGSVSRAGSVAQGLQGMGFSGAAALAQRAALPLAVAGKAFETVEKAAPYFYDKYSTGDQLSRRAVRDFLPGGERIQRFTDAVSGREFKYEQARIDAQRRGFAEQAQQEQFRSNLSINPQIAASRGAEQYYRTGTPVMPSLINRSSAEGERAFREEQRILPLKQAEARAEKDMVVATKERIANAKELSNIGAYGRKLAGERLELENKLKRSENQSGASRERILQQIKTVNDAIGANAGTERQASGQFYESVRRQAEAKAELGKARTRTRLIGEAENLEARADTAAGAARRLGGMNAFDRAFGLQAARMIRERGSVEGLPPELVQAAMGFAPETIGKIIERTGSETAEFKAGVAEFNADFAGSPEELRRRATELRRDAAQIEFKIDAATASEVTRSFEAAGRDIARLISLGLDKMKAELENTIRLGRNQ